MGRLKFYCLAMPCFEFLWKTLKYMVSRSHGMFFCNSHPVPKCTDPASSEGVPVAAVCSAFAVLLWSGQAKVCAGVSF